MTQPQTAPASGTPGRPPASEPPDLREKGAPKNGQPQALDERLFMQLLAFGAVKDASPLVRTLQHSGFESVLYADLNDPRGVALLTFSKD